MGESKEGDHVDEENDNEIDEGINNGFPDIEISNKWEEYDYMKELTRGAISRKEEKKEDKQPSFFEIEFLPKLLTMIEEGKYLEALMFNGDLNLEEIPSYKKALKENPDFQDLITLKKLRDVIYIPQYEGDEYEWNEERFQSLIDSCKSCKKSLGGVNEITKNTSKQTNLVFTEEN